MPSVVFNVAYTAKMPPNRMFPEKKASYLARRDFYTLNSEYNYFEYILNDKKVVKNKDVLNYMEKNSGAFTLDKVLNDDEKDLLAKDLKKTESIIWHGVISFDGEAHKGISTQENARRFLKQTFGSFLDRTHLKKENVQLLAALHKDTDNNHIHFIFWEKEAMRRNKYGELCYTSKGNINIKSIENYLVSANMHLSENSYDYYTARDRAMERLKQLRAVGLSCDKRELRQSVLDLVKKIPTTGRLQYNSKNMEGVRKDIDLVSEQFIKSDKKAYLLDSQLKAIIAEKESQARKMCSSEVHKQFCYINDRELKGEELQALLKKGKTEYIRNNRISWENIDYFERLRQDYKARIGNLILGLCQDSRNNIKEKKRSAYNNKQKKIASRTMRRHVDSAVYHFQKSLSNYQKGINADFTNHLNEIMRELESEQYSMEEYAV